MRIADTGLGLRGRVGYEVQATRKILSPGRGLRWSVVLASG